MAFLFKSKKNQDRALSSRDGNAHPPTSMAGANARIQNEKHRATPTGSVNSLENDAVTTPERKVTSAHSRRGGSVDNNNAMANPPTDAALRNGPAAANPNASLYPWSQRRITYTTQNPSPFPRYGAAVNSASSKEGDIYMMGGLINSSTVKGDLWMIEAGGSMSCYPLPTTAEGPGPRVGHSSLLVGNAFIVYGGDTKIEDSDVLDETLYLLNTSTRHWSRALPAGPRPSGRYGHSLNILGSKIYIFGGQVEGYFMNDLSAFDLNQLQMANNRWEILLQSEASPSIPAARTNHTVITYNDKMYLFGGTNGFEWFNDVWCYDPQVNKWSQLDCIGYIPSRREGHAAALVDDVMYIFGGRTEEGTDLGDLAAFRISLRRWYTFQNMGPSPSPRSGHSMTTVGKSIVVLGGEPSTAASTVNDLGILYVLDTSKIRYPADAQQSSIRSPQAGRPSLETLNRQAPGASNVAQDPKRITQGAAAGAVAGAATVGATVAATNGSGPISSPDSSRSLNPTSPELQGPAGVGSKLPRPTPPPAASPPQAPAGSKSPPEPPAIGRVRGASVDRPAAGSPKPGSAEAPTRQLAADPEGPVSAAVNGQRSPPQSLRSPSGSEKSRAPRPSQGSIDSTLESSRANRPSSPPPPTRQGGSLVSRRSSGRNSQTVALLKELDAARNKNAWYASELELARKGGYVPNTSSVALEKSSQTFDDEDKPVIEALLTMRTELANVQSAVDKQAVVAAKQIAEAERQRDAAIQEALYAKAKVAAASTAGSAASTPQLDGERDDVGRVDGISKKLATALHVQKEQQTHIENLKSELEAERRARQLADETSNAAEKRLAHLESYKQQTSAEVERLKSELHLSQREAREHSVSASDAVSALALLKAEKEDVTNKYNDAVGTSKNHDETFTSLRAAMKASEDGKSHVEKKLAEERTARERLETKFNKLKVEHEARTAELVASTQRLRDAEELAEKNANEARQHRAVVLSGLDKITLRDSPKSNTGETERSTALQSQVASSSALVKKYQQELDAAADKLRSAEERIAGLEQYQEQSSREGVSIRRQLQAALRETQSLQAAHSDVKNQLAAQQLETNAMTVQHNALKDILNERGISPTTAVRSRGLASPRTTSPEQTRLRELESQLASSHASHEETKQAFAVQAQESDSAYREKLTQLENDYQSAVHYVKGTEKMLRQLQEQLQRYKADNARLKTEKEGLEDRMQNGESNGRSLETPVAWETEKHNLEQQIGGLQEELRSSSSQLEKKYAGVQKELADLQKDKEHSTKQLATYVKDLDQLRSENDLLEQRATAAETRVTFLLEQVEHSVDNYRRRSRQANMTPVDVGGSNGVSHTRQESSEAESVYGGGSHGNADGRSSAALENLASELETLRTHWEATNKNYRLSNTFDFDPPVDLKKDDDTMAGAGLSESLADWRKKLDAEEHAEGRKSK
ncbi:Kelch-type beta propeller [Cordyceps fumosorosea ARSEF 2679]|uniref:Kelch-type beta propeller n=1 Tax=Cordyceps fumosorosea (strain ARSEF 2679) TaxID=1081104 RepID=A0A167ZKY9_CORFA|nr:Kelch-type beta propeller [Cordyceps fumosorosea ARSEF 2679]OAA67638.1 Kelch-type beta propeller [Cordyceps fumosorosea ARSEF 2679]